MRHHPSLHRPYPRTGEPETGGIHIRRPVKPQLACAWIPDETGQLTYSHRRVS